MSTIDEIFRKPFDVQTLQAQESAEGINQNFDAIWWALAKLRDAVNELGESSGSSAGNALLDGSVHTDTDAETVVQGDLVVGNSTPKWDRLPRGTSGQLLTMSGSDPAWATFTSASFPHNILSATHSDSVAADVALGALITGQYLTDPSTRGALCWADGAPFEGIFTGNDNGTVKFWADGAPGASIDGGSGTTAWKRLVQGTPGQVLVVGASGLEWQTIAGVGTGLSARVYRSTDQSLTNAADNTITFEASDWDDNGYWSASAPSKLTAPENGVYVVVGAISFPQGTFGLSWTRIFVNGTMRAQEQGGLNNVDPTYAPPTGFDVHLCSAVLKLTAGDYVELHGWPVRYSGALPKAEGGQNDTWLSIVRVG